MTSRTRLFLFLILTLFSACVATIFYMQFNGNTGFSNGVESSFEELVAQFRGEPLQESLVVYSAMVPEQVDEYVAAFSSKHPGIMVEYEVMGTVELIERLMAEKNNPQADVIWGLSATVMQQLAWNDVLQPYAPVGLEHMPDNFRDSNDPPIWVGQDIWMNAFCVNRDLLAEANVAIPLSWEELLDPKYEGLIAFPSPLNSGTGYMTLLAYFEIFGATDAWDSLDRLHKNVSSYEFSPSGTCTAAADGEVAIGISYGLAASEQRKRSSSLAIVFPEEGSGWDMEAAGLVRQFPTNQDAYTLMDYIISEDAMHLYGLHYAITAIPVDYIQAPFGFPEDSVGQLMSKNFVWAGANRNRLLNEWEARYRVDNAP